MALPGTVARVSPALEPVTLAGRLVRLEPLGPQHVDGLAVAGAGDRSTYAFSPVPRDAAEARAYVDQALAAHAAGTVLPFAQVSAATGEVLGSTRYLSARWETGRREPDEIEIGGTWLAAPAQRTGVNTEAKLLLLRHAFTVYGVWRVEIVTDADNARSRAAIERLGATFEGVLRNFRRKRGDATTGPQPVPRQTAVYSILPHEWPTIEARLEARLAAHGHGPGA